MRKSATLLISGLAVFTGVLSASCQGDNPGGATDGGAGGVSSTSSSIGGTGGAGGGPSSPSSSSTSSTGVAGGAGGSGGSDPGSGGGQPSCDIPCGLGQKVCVTEAGRTCRSVEDAAVGCGGQGCSPCPTYSNAIAACISGACALSACLPGFVDCDMNAANGCEAHIADEPANCGACGNACAAGDRCIGGRCVATCGPPYTICNGLCTDIQTTPQACGGCDHRCPEAPPGQSVECVAGSCVYAPLSCPAGLAACDGVCTDLTANRAHCGGCGVACQDRSNAIAACDAGACEPCPPGTTAACDPYRCTDLAHDNNACGACGSSCPSGNVCVDGHCADPAALRIVQATVSDFVVDGALVYFVDATGGTINSAPVDGGPITELAGFQERPGHIAVDAERILWTNMVGGHVLALPKAGGPPAVVASEPGSTPDYVVSDGINAYFIATDRVLAAPLAGGAPTLLYQSPINVSFGTRARLSDLTQNSTMLFFTIHEPDVRLIHSIRKDGTPSGLPELGGASAVATDTDLFTIASAFNPPGDLVRSSLVGGAGQLLWRGALYESENAAVDALAVDGEDLFFFGMAGIEHVLTCGTRMPDVLVSVPRAPVRRLAVDSGYVYWSDGASISRIAR